MRRVTAAAALFLLTLAPEHAVAQRADTIVKEATRPAHPGVASLVRELRFGEDTGAEEYLFGEVSELAVDRDGSIFIFDRQAPALRKYDANGRFVRTFGRSGQGPGEYRNAGGLALLRDGRVLLWDGANWRFNVYAPDGAVLPAWPTPSGTAGGSIGTSRALMVDTSGRIVYLNRTLFSREPGLRNSRRVWIRYRDDGTPLDTIDAPSFLDPSAALTATSSSGRSSTSTSVPYHPQRRQAMSPFGHLVSGLPSRYAFEIHRDGGAVTSVRREVPPTPVTRQERDSARNAVIERMRQVNPSWSWNGPEIPRNKPAYEQLYTGDDGRIWVALVAEQSEGGPFRAMMGGGAGGPPGVQQRPATARPEPRPALYDVYEPDGTYLGQVRVPAGFRSFVRRGNHVWGVEIGDDDVPRVARYRIAWP
jgi:hypothetical protein